jgi:hypothetical protein
LRIWDLDFAGFGIYGRKERKWAPHRDQTQDTVD